MTLAVGNRLDRYEILSSLGRGGMGEVYLALDTRLKRRVALKVLPREWTRDPVRLRRFQQEAEAASALNHPNIITIHEFGEADDDRFIVMEFVEGCTLRSLIRERPPPGECARIVAQTARALGVAHAAGITHRDIKPDNIMVRPDGYVKVLDFGLARLAPSHPATSEEETAPATAPGGLVGTLRYMSPEQARGEPLTTGTDMFSLGVVLFELATGRHPFPAETPFGVLHAILSETAPLPSSLNPALPMVFDLLIPRMLAKTAKERPPAIEVEEALAEIGRDTGSRTAMPTNAPPSPPLRHTVGRERELRELQSALATATQEHGLLLCISGEPGIGKTTLAESFLAGLPDTGGVVAVARGRCSERLAGSEAYLPLIESLHSLLRVEGGEALARLMKQLAASWYAQIAPANSGSESEPGTSGHPRAGSQERLKFEVGAFLQEISRRRPLVVFFDDLHWADASTIDVLAYLAARFDGLRALILVTFRPSDLALSRHPFLQLKRDLQGRGMCREICLEFLCVEEVATYLGLEFPNHRFPPDFPGLIHSRTEGNPLFMTDLIRHLRECDVISQASGWWTVSPPITDLAREFPESVRAMIERKIDQLDDGDRQLLVAAAVQGYEFDAAIISRAVAMDAMDVEERLGKLDRIHAWVRLVEERELPDGTWTLRYRFLHVLYQNALHQSAPPARRIAWSRVIAEALVESYREQSTTIALELANLFEAAREFDRATTHLLTASRAAARVFAYREVIVLHRRAQPLLERLPNSPTRIQRELEFQLVSGPALIAVMGYAAPEVQDVYDRAGQLCRQTGNTPHLFGVLYNTWLIDELKADVDASLEIATQCLALAQESGETAKLLMAHGALGETRWARGEFGDARPHLEQAMRLYDRQSHHSLVVLYGGYDLGVAARVDAGHTLWYLGFPEAALILNQSALDLARELAHPHTTLFALCHAAFLLHLRRETEAAGRRAEEAFALARELGFPFWLGYAEVLLGRTRVAHGDAPEGCAQIQRGICGYRSTGCEVEVPFLTALLAEACLLAGRFDEGLAALAEVLPAVEHHKARFHEADLHRLQGELLLRAGATSTRGDAIGEQEANAEASFRRALEVARSQQAKSLELRAAASLARLLSKRGRKQEAAMALARATDGFPATLLSPDLDAARALLAQLR